VKDFQHGLGPVGKARWVGFIVLMDGHILIRGKRGTSGNDPFSKPIGLLEVS
jgi:hypothetical protein